MMKHSGTVNLETERLILRPLTMNDAEAAHKNWMGDENVTEFLRWKTHACIDETREVLSKWSESYRHPDFYLWGIVPKDLGEPIGCISAVRIDESVDMIEIGYCIGSQWWGQRYVPEALSQLLNFFFNRVEALRVEARHDPNNKKSGRVMKKCGMIYEGTLRGASRNNQGIVDACVYGILKEDYDRITEFLT